MGDASDIGKRATLSDQSGCDGSFANPGPDGPIADNAPPNLSTRGARANASAGVRGGYSCFASDGDSGGAGRVTGWRGGNEAEATVGERERAIQCARESNLVGIENLDLPANPLFDISMAHDAGASTTYLAARRCENPVSKGTERAGKYSRL
jgi:hypothetical protein